MNFIILCLQSTNYTRLITKYQPLKRQTKTIINITICDLYADSVIGNVFYDTLDVNLIVQVSSRSYMKSFGSDQINSK